MAVPCMGLAGVGEDPWSPWLGPSSWVAAGGTSILVLWHPTADPHCPSLRRGRREGMGWSLAVPEPCRVSPPALGAAGGSVSFHRGVSPGLSALPAFTCRLGPKRSRRWAERSRALASGRCVCEVLWELHSQRPWGSGVGLPLPLLKWFYYPI